MAAEIQVSEGLCTQCGERRVVATFDYYGHNECSLCNKCLSIGARLVREKEQQETQR